MSKHTKGPWQVDKRNPWRISANGGRDTVASTGGDSQLVGFHESNARLIAAAPCMYEALQMVERLHSGGMPEAIHSKVRAALAKANPQTES